MRPLEPDERMWRRIPDDLRASIGNMPVLNPFHTAALAFSDRVSRDRIAFGRDLDANLTLAKVYKWLTVGFGTFATILMSVRAVTPDNSRLSLLVGVSAIVVSAIGAGVSSMNSFDRSSTIALRDQRALSQLQQLHWRIASDLMRRPEMCAAEPKPAKMTDALEVVSAWRTRLEAILDSATDSLSKPGDISDGSPSKDVSPGKTDNDQRVAANK